MVRFLSSALAALALLSVGIPQARADVPYTVGDTILAFETASPTINCIVDHESHYNPNAVGAAGEQGPIQLLPAPRGGQWLPFFYGDWTETPPEYRNVHNPWQARAFIEWYTSIYGFGAWSTHWGCGV